MSDFNSRLKHYQQRIDKALDDCLPDGQAQKYKLTEAMRYSVIGGGGKRIRPAMVYAAGEAMDVDQNILDTPAFAVECIENWWEKYGRVQYPNTNELLILADAGGSNGYRSRVWKYDRFNSGGGWGLGRFQDRAASLGVTIYLTKTDVGVAPGPHSTG